ncbi:alpha/beta hydrolase [Anaeromyxobacter oryzae]|uniref:Hydrolase n=1 Tax=Anaeromyxobacter oryzae TaxID=2918170 RepID=A0ABM7WV52_9BACT|nr:alpha/beta hydrolase [Anaeromyxobacter oryzae]BDG03384.1 hydrolase [Anaeromyxobacter oryzae]
MQPLLAALAAVLVLALLAGLHYAFWTWRLRAPPIEDGIVHAPTRDGWVLALGRRRPRGVPRAPPVLLVHGIAMNRQTFEFGLVRWALADHLARAGFDCFSLDHRGHGASRRGPGASRRWNLDDYVREDIPAALDAIRRETGAERVLYVGHSQGGIMGLAACALYPDRIAAIAALGAPAHYDVQDRLKKLVALRFTWVGRFTRLAARMLAPFAGYWHPAVFDLAIQLRNVEPRVFRRLLANGLENLQPGVLSQFAAFIREDSFRSMDGKLDYRASLERCRQPALFLAAEKDGLAPPSVVQAAFRRWGGPKEYAIVGQGFGHADLLLGRSAPETVYPLVERFLLAHSREVAGASAPRAATDPK